MSEHLQVLRRVGLVREEPSGRERHYHLSAEPLAEVAHWLHPFERYWRDRLRPNAARSGNMGPGWRDEILPALAKLLADGTPAT